MYSLLRALLFRLSPETAHEVSLEGLNALYRLRLDGLLAARKPVDPVQVFGLRMANRLGLAAGLDKNGDYLDALGALGFGHVEVGTVTPRPQPGNDAPRLFRLTEDQALINRMGFNNLGVEHLAANLRQRKYPGVVGVNIGKNRDTPVENAAQDYLYCLQRVYRHADYVTVNLSSPNTPGLRGLQEGEAMRALLQELMHERARLADRFGVFRPLVVKVAPDFDLEAIDGLADVLLESGVDGVIATNTTVTRPASLASRWQSETGGLSGAPLRESALAVVKRLADRLDGRLPIVGVGGIMNGRDASERIQAGASLVQIYSGFIYRGPELIRECLEDLPAS